jgi:hypothetical protein
MRRGWLILGAVILASCTSAEKHDPQTSVTTEPHFESADDAYNLMTASEGHFGLDCTSLGSGLDPGELDRMSCRVTVVDGHFELFFTAWDDSYFAESDYRDRCDERQTWLIWEEDQYWIVEVSRGSRNPNPAIVRVLADGLGSTAWANCTAVTSVA